MTDFRLALLTDSVPRSVGGPDGVFLERLESEYPRIVRVVRRLLAWPGTAADVDDVVQDVLVAAWTRRGSLRDEKALRSWLERIAVNQVRNHQRARQRRRRLCQLMGLGAREELAAPDTTPSEAVRDAMRRMNHADREVLVLRYLEGYGPEEIGKRLRLRRNAVDARLSRARKRLKELLEP